MRKASPRAEVLLIVEDDHVQRELLSMLLGREGYRTVEAANGQEGLDFLQSGLKPDLILLDMLMPVLDGWHFLGRLHDMPAAAGLPVVVSTATILTREWAESHGCAGFLRKPIQPEQLLAEVDRCLPADSTGQQS
jgi:CheY-like chemotaxis protein